MGECQCFVQMFLLLPKNQNFERAIFPPQEIDFHSQTKDGPRLCFGEVIPQFFNIFF
jgi:hypothetical protein